MPRSAVATSPEREAGPTTTLDQLLARGRTQGRLSLAELRDAFDRAALSPAQSRSILRDLTDSGVDLDAEPASANTTTGKATRKKATATTASAKTSTTKSSKTGPRQTSGTGRASWCTWM